jgi:hypothetical protein
MLKPDTRQRKNPLNRQLSDPQREARSTGSEPWACSTLAAIIGFSAVLRVVEIVGTQSSLVFYNGFPNRSRVKHISSLTAEAQGKLREYLLSKRAFGTKNNFIDAPSFETQTVAWYTFP